MNVKKDMLGLLAANLTKNKALLTMLIALLAFAGNAVAYTPTYTSDDLGTSIIDLIVTFVVAITTKAPTLAGLIVVLLTMIIIGGIFGALAAAVAIAFGVIKLPKLRRAG